MTECKFVVDHDTFKRISNEKHDFALTDERHRAIGARAMIYTYTGKIPTESWQTPYWESDVEHFFVRVQATRNGEDYGASQGSTEFATLAEAEAFVEKRLVASRKAAVKKAALPKKVARPQLPPAGRALCNAIVD